MADDEESVCDRSKPKAIWIWTLECELRSVQTSVYTYSKRTEIDIDPMQLDKSLLKCVNGPK